MEIWWEPWSYDPLMGLLGVLSLFTVSGTHRRDTEDAEKDLTMFVCGREVERDLRKR